MAIGACSDGMIPWISLMDVIMMDMNDMACQICVVSLVNTRGWLQGCFKVSRCIWLSRIGFYHQAAVAYVS